MSEHATINLYNIYMKGVDSGDEASNNHLPTYRAKRSFAAVFCQFFSAKNIPKDRHVHGGSPPVSVAVFFCVS